MLRVIRTKITAGLAIALLGGYAAVGAFAAPDVTPWPDPIGSGSDHAVTQDETEDVVNDGTADGETPDDGTGNAELIEHGEIGQVAETLQQGADGAGVPPDSPACTGDLEDPSQHDTDGDGDGCREVETDDGMKNLPDPAADAHEGNPGTIGRGDEHGFGPPDGVPLGPPIDVPPGPPSDVPPGPPSDVPPGPPSDVPLGPPDGVPPGGQ